MIDGVIAWAQTLGLVEAIGILVGGGVALYVAAMRVIAAVRRIVVRFVVRHSILAGLGFAGISLEAFLPDGIAGVVRWALSLAGVGG